MINELQLRNLISNNFTNAVISDDADNKDTLSMRVSRVSSNLKPSYIQLYSKELKEIINNPKELLAYILDNYLSTNNIVRVDYFYNTEEDNKNKFIIYGLNRTLMISLENENLKLLPIDFISKIENAKKKGILSFLEKNNINKLHLHSFDNISLFNQGITGLKKDTKEDNAYHYYAFRIEDVNGNLINYDEEASYVFKMLEILIEKNMTDLDTLKLYRELFKFGYYNTLVGYLLNEDITVLGSTRLDLLVVHKFISKYLENYCDEVKDNQMKLALKKKGI